MTVQEKKIFYKGSNFYVMEDGTIVREPNLRDASYEVALAYFNIINRKERQNAR